MLRSFSDPETARSPAHPNRPSRPWSKTILEVSTVSWAALQKTPKLCPLQSHGFNRPSVGSVRFNGLSQTWNRAFWVSGYTCWSVSWDMEHQTGFNSLALEKGKENQVGKQGDPICNEGFRNKLKMSQRSKTLNPQNHFLMQTAALWHQSAEKARWSLPFARWGEYSSSSSEAWKTGEALSAGMGRKPTGYPAKVVCRLTSITSIVAKNQTPRCYAFSFEGLEEWPMMKTRQHSKKRTSRPIQKFQKCLSLEGKIEPWKPTVLESALTHI